MTQRHRLLLSAIVVLSSCASFAQAPTPTMQKLSLKQAETIAITNHPQIQAATFTAAAAQQASTAETEVRRSVSELTGAMFGR